MYITTKMPTKKEVEFETRDGLTLRGLLTLLDAPNVPLVIFVSPVRLCRAIDGILEYN